MSMLDLWVVDGSQSKVTDVPVNCILLSTHLHHASTTVEIDRPSYRDGGLSELSIPVVDVGAWLGTACSLSATRHLKA
jgi:hypothetical protein